ncbi:MAG: ASKHA domain-containing protein [Candidatus Hermodarchaeota archaeon]
MQIKNRNIIIDLEPISRRIHFSRSNSLYEILADLKIPIRSLCGGLGTCGKCKILVQNGSEYLSPLTNAEKKLLDKDEIENDWRLACEIKLDMNKVQILEEINPPQFRIFIPSEFLLREFNILTSGISKGIRTQPAIKKVYIEVKKPSLDEPYSDFERIQIALYSKYPNLNKKNKIDIDFDLLNDIPLLLRQNEHKITLVIWDCSKIIACEPNNTIEENFGIAFDIGTTTIVGYLINLNNGKVYSVDSKLNSQTAYGEDLITRLTYIKESNENLHKLNSLIINDLNDIIKITCEKANIKPSQIYEATVVGNSVMHHIFLKLDPVNIGLSPFVPVIQKNLNIKAKELNLNISQNGNVYTAPIIAGYVGADTIGVILASEIYNEKKLTLAIDIGTNGELIVGNNKILAVGSCAAGSALEGAHIRDGMRAAAGAIDSVEINPKTFNITYTTIKNRKPIGICGSGLVDIIAEMLRTKILTRSGNFNREFLSHERFIKTDKKFEFIIANKEETSLEREITISQSDIRQIQMAKAAFYSGLRIIMLNLKRNLKIEQIFLAGAFGNYINAQNAKFIGMIPDIENHKIFQIGNAAGIGAQYCLLNRNIRDKAQQLLKKIKYIEIAINKTFQNEYAEAMYFPHLNLGLFPSLVEFKDIPKR